MMVGMHKAAIIDGTAGILMVVWAVTRVVERAREIKVPAVDLAGTLLDDMVRFCFCIELI